METAPSTTCGSTLRTRTLTWPVRGPGLRDRTRAARTAVTATLTRPYETYYIWTPGGRSNATSFIDSLGELWLFGGEGYDSTSTTGNGYLNDMWRYLPYKN